MPKNKYNCYCFINEDFFYVKCRHSYRKPKPVKMQRTIDVWCPAPIGISLIHPFHLRVREQREGTETVRTKGEILSFMNDLKAAHMKSQYFGYLKKT